MAHQDHPHPRHPLAHIRMTDEQIAKKKQNAGAKKPSMKRRDDHHDYTERRIYMITIEAEGRRPLFGTLKGDPYAPADSEQAPHIQLSEIGQAIQNEWMGIHDYYPQIEVKAIQMMPDHLHGILFVTAPLPVHLGQVISGFKAGCRKALRALEQAAAQKAAAASKAATTGNAAAAGKAAAKPLPTEKALPAKKAPASQQVAAPPLPPSRSLFAKGYNDLILRSYDELPTWINYLRDNPRRLMLKRARPEFLRPFFHLRIGSQTYSGIGNRQLLAAPHRMAVRLSRRLTDSEIEREISRHLEAARQGVVLVSPAISPAEKRVMRAVFDAGFPTIVLMENGFGPLSKPHGEQFYACSKGTLLMLSPWEHHNERRNLTAYQCQQLNLMALEIAQLK
ncbi:hypothetical protein [Xylanibacter brevis]|uniref:hypothetical protein n=1 Tax=Xylanibacter brevis TaxID=83231 RepID=UPI0012DCE944|nr:hypothetical protein [Xylanibacter brevis]